MLIIMFVLIGYFFYLQNPLSPTPTPSGIDDHRAYQQTWEEKRPVSYRYVVHRRCECSREYSTPYVATEDRNSRTALFRTPVDSTEGEMLVAPPNAVWIDDLFDIAASAAASSNLVRISYHAQFGYPTIVEVRPAGSSGYTRYEIRDFEVVVYR